MALIAQLVASFDSSDRAQFVADWAEDAPACPTVAATRVHVKNLQTGDVYYTKGLTGGETRPASITKMMTALVLLQHKSTLTDLAETTTVMSDAISEGTSASFQPGDVVSLHDLLAFAMLPSDNAAAAMLGYVIGCHLLGGTPTYAQAKTRFVTQMNTQASALGMSATTYINAHGLGNNASSPLDTNTLMAVLVKKRVLRDIWRFSSWNASVVRGGSTITVESPAGYGNGYPGMVGGKGGSLTGLFNRGILWEAPNGHMIALTTFGSPTIGDLSADSAAIIAALPTDYPALATPATAFTPAYLFDTLGLNGGWFDGSDTAHMWQDAAGTTQVTGASQPVGKWSPKAGSASIYWRQATDASRPIYNGASTGLTFDGTNDYLDLGAGSFGDASLFADDTEQFIVVQKFSGTGGTLVSRAGATTTSRTFQSYVDSATSAEPAVWLRGSQTWTDANLADGSQHSANVFWDGTAGGMGRIDLGAKQMLVGTAADEAGQNITLGGRTGGTAGFLTGSVQQIVLVDSYDADTFRRLRDWSNGATINAFAYSAGEITEVVHSAEGAMSGTASIVGSATRFRAHAAEGAIAAGPAQISGTTTHVGVVVHEASGTLTGTASIAGAVTASHWHQCSGALSGVAAITGSATRTAAPVAGEVTLSAQSISDIVAAVLSALNATTIPVDVQKMSVSGGLTLGQFLALK